MKIREFTFLLGIFFVNYPMFSQSLSPGFDRSEYIDMLKINNLAHVELNKWSAGTSIPAPDEYNFVYRSPRVAFDNIWDLWMHKNKKIAVIAVQGSIQTSASFLANLYAAMVPATGELELDKNTTWKYKLSSDPNSAVHVGWLVALAYMSGSIEQKIDSCYKAGIRDFILTGHSQGGGITFLVNAYLTHLQLDGKLPKDIRFKTYCSAGPKPGNRYFAYEYEYVNKAGWAYNVINSADWVPDVPFTVQTVNDFTAVNPFRGAKSMIRKQKFPKNLALKHVYNKMSKPSEKAQRNYQKYLGKMVSKAVVKQLPGMTIPLYYDSNYYVRTGNTIMLYATEDYFKIYSNDPNNPNIWQHHLPAQYLYLAEKRE